MQCNLSRHISKAPHSPVVFLLSLHELWNTHFTHTIPTGILYSYIIPGFDNPGYDIVAPTGHFLILEAMKDFACIAQHL